MKRKHEVVMADPANHVVLVYIRDRGIGTLQFDAVGNAYWTDAVSAKTTKIEGAFVPDSKA